MICRTSRRVSVAVWKGLGLIPVVFLLDGCRVFAPLPLATRAHPPPWGRNGLREEIVEFSEKEAIEPTTDERPPLTMEFVRIPAGVYIQGAPAPDRPDDPFTDRREDAKPLDWSPARPTRVVFIDAFEITKYEVTQYQWTSVMGTNPSGTTRGMAPETTENYPVENVSWNDIQEFIRRLNERDKAKGWRYRLPTEAEWEYACGGDCTLYGWGNDVTQIEQYAWTRRNSPRGTHPVGLLRPNRFGLYDMHGNVFEWCRDWYRPGYPPPPPDNDPIRPVRNPQGPPDGPGRVIRGGAWNKGPIECIAFYRTWADPQTRTWSIGFRLVRERIAPASDSAPAAPDTPPPKTPASPPPETKPKS